MPSEGMQEEIYVRIYHRLLDLVPSLLGIKSHSTSEVEGMMALNFEVLRYAPQKLIIGLSHDHRHKSGDLIPDPSMMIAVYPDRGMAEALTYQDAYIFTAIYSPDGDCVDVRARRDLNDFLDSWLTNLIEQGHSIKS